MAEGGDNVQHGYQRRSKTIIGEEELKAEMKNFRSELEGKIDIVIARNQKIEENHKRLEERLTSMEELIKKYFEGPPLEVTKPGQDEGSRAKGGQHPEEGQGVHDTEVVESNTLLSSEAPRNKRRAEWEHQQEEGEHGTRKRAEGNGDPANDDNRYHNHISRQDISTSCPTEEITPTDIIGVRMTEQERKEVMVKWKGWPWNSCTWEPADWMMRQYPAFHLEDKVRLWEGGIDRYGSPRTGVQFYTPNPRRGGTRLGQHMPNRLRQQDDKATTDGGSGRWGSRWERQPEQLKERGPTRGARIRAAHWGNNHGGAFIWGGRQGGIPIKQEARGTYDGGGELGGWIWE